VSALAWAARLAVLAPAAAALAGTMVRRGDRRAAAGVAVGGAALATWAWRMRESDPPLSAAGLRLGLRGFGVASVLNALVGLTWLGLLPTAALRTFAEGTAGSLVVVAAAGLGLGTLWIAFVAVVTRVERLTGAQLLSGVAVLGATMVAMALLRDRLRTVMIAPTGYSAPSSQTQWDVVALFGICLAAAIIAIGWMVRQYVLAGANTRRAAAARV